MNGTLAGAGAALLGAAAPAAQTLDERYRIRRRRLNDTGVPRSGRFAAYWEELGLPGHFDFVEPTGAARDLRFARDNFDPWFWDEAAANIGWFCDGNAFGTTRGWHRDIFASELRNVPLEPRDRADLLDLIGGARLLREVLGTEPQRKALVEQIRDAYAAALGAAKPTDDNDATEVTSDGTERFAWRFGLGQTRSYG